MVADADAYRSEYTTKTGKQCSRRLPKQAIIGVQVIVNPPSVVADTWSRETHFKFQRDAAEVLEEIEPRLFRSDNVMMRAHHFDEGKEDCATDTHTVYTAKDENGHYCGSIYDANLRQRMAKEFAEKMRSRGWDIDNPELTDWERYETDAEYKEHIDSKRKKQGKSQPEYDAQQIVERAEKMEQLGVELQAAADVLRDTQEQTQAAIAERDAVITERDSAVSQRDAAIADRDKAKEQRDKTENRRKLIAGKRFKRGGEVMLGVEGLEEKRKELQNQIEELEIEYRRKRKRNDTMEEETTQIQAAHKDAKDTFDNLQTQFIALSEQVSEMQKQRVEESDVFDYMSEVVNDTTVVGSQRFERILDTQDEYGQTPRGTLESAFGSKLSKLMEGRLMNAMRCILRVFQKSQQAAVEKTKQKADESHKQRVREFSELLGDLKEAPEGRNTEMEL